jgi:type II secretory pathway component PulF
MNKKDSAKLERLLAKIDQQLINNCATMIEVGEKTADLIDICEEAIEALKDNNKLLEMAKAHAISNNTPS